mmetsp:Transcript_31832/g.83417  ORF Transcript_31832/g.83417 Transcript_31832/m.83417 type:complete len:210 (+) Transcript_31832:269-898(+)
MGWLSRPGFGKGARQIDPRGRPYPHHPRGPSLRWILATTGNGCEGGVCTPTGAEPHVHSGNAVCFCAVDRDGRGGRDCGGRVAVSVQGRAHRGGGRSCPEARCRLLGGARGRRRGRSCHPGRASAARITVRSGRAGDADSRLFPRVLWRARCWWRALRRCRRGRRLVDHCCRRPATVGSHCRWLLCTSGRLGHNGRGCRRKVRCTAPRV